MSKWLDRTQPQTLYIATMLLYFQAALSLLGVILIVTGISGLGVVGAIILGVDLVSIALTTLGAWGIANEKRWGFWLSAVIAVLLLLNALRGLGIISLIFDIALVALLFHPQSTAYRKIWFK